MINSLKVEDFLRAAPNPHCSFIGFWGKAWLDANKRNFLRDGSIAFEKSNMFFNDLIFCRRNNQEKMEYYGVLEVETTDTSYRKRQYNLESALESLKNKTWVTFSVLNIDISLDEHNKLCKGQAKDSVSVTNIRAMECRREYLSAMKQHTAPRIMAITAFQKNIYSNQWEHPGKDAHEERTGRYVYMGIELYYGDLYHVEEGEIIKGPDERIEEYFKQIYPNYKYEQ